MNPTLKDIAKQLNVSTAAVSRALNDLPGVGDELRARAREAAARLGYTKHLQAAAGHPHERNMKLIAVLYGPLGWNIIGELQYGIDTTARKKGYHLLTYMVDIFRELHSEESKDAFLDKLAAERGMAGVLACGVHFSDVLIAKLYQRNVPVVLLEDFTEFGRCVTINNVKASQRAVSKLIELGRRRIGCITPPEEAPAWRDRLAGYRRALKENGVPYDPTLIVYQPWVGVKPGGLATRKLLQLHPEVDAILYASDSLACGGMKALRGLGRRVPDDIAVIGFDDDAYDIALQPSLTSVRQPIRRMAEIGFDLLLDSVEKRDLSPRHVELDTELILRGSCLKECDEAE